MNKSEILDYLQQALDALEQDKPDIGTAIDCIACVINPLANPQTRSVREEADA